MPIAALEAVIAGCPVLLSDIEPNRALGFAPQNYFAVGSVSSLGNKLRGDHAGYRIERSTILESCNWKNASARMHMLYSLMEDELRARRGRSRWRPPLLISGIWRLGFAAGTGARRITGHNASRPLQHEDATRH